MSSSMFGDRSRYTVTPITRRLIDSDSGLIIEKLQVHVNFEDLRN
jgi:hypothetical protein